MCTRFHHTHRHFLQKKKSENDKAVFPQPHLTPDSSRYIELFVKKSIPNHKFKAYASTFWGFLCLGRLISVPVALKLSPARMLFGSIIGVAVAGMRVCVCFSSRGPDLSVQN